MLFIMFKQMVFVAVPVQRSERTRFPFYKIGTRSIFDLCVLFTDVGICSSMISRLMFANSTHKNMYAESVNINVQVDLFLA